MMNVNSHFGTLRYLLIMYTYLVYLCRSLLEQQIELVLIPLYGQVRCFDYVYADKGNVKFQKIDTTNLLAFYIPTKQKCPCM